MAANYNELIKDNFVKIIACLLLITILIIIGVGLLTDKHISLWVIEFNGNKKEAKVDTIYINKDSISRNKEERIAKINSSKRQDELARKLIADPKSDNSKKIFDNKQAHVDELNQNYGPNNGVIGGNNNTVINSGIQPRILSDLDFEDFFRNFPNKHTRIAVDFVNARDGEMENVKAQILSILRKNGYNNLGVSSGMSMGGNSTDYIYLSLQPDSSVIFHVPPKTR